MDDQERFAQLSGDRNPMHLDAIAARRTPAGAPIVHGINLLLWALNTFASSNSGLPPLRRLRAQFKRPVFLDEVVSVVADDAGPARARLRLLAQDGLRSDFILEFGALAEAAPASWTTQQQALPIVREAQTLGLEQTTGLGGRLLMQMSIEGASTQYPAATEWLGAEAIRGLSATSHLVGMVCPGLHSIYSELVIDSCPRSEQLADVLAFRVRLNDPRYSMVEIEVACTSFYGVVKAFLRVPPVVQATMDSLSGVVAPHEFAGSATLIVGGSRGLGELTAKLVASGGGRVQITWQSGKEDALRVADEIRVGGGQCDVIHYDARRPTAAQFGSLDQPPTHAYYFATPRISHPRSDVFVSRRFGEFLQFYVDGFWQLTQSLRARRKDIKLFYPSSVFVTERPPGMTEYAMAKAAGESLCADINHQLAPTHVTVMRLPRLPTDQTTSLTPIKLGNALAVMLPIVREVQARGRDR
jgi:hypothetical protein